VNRADYDRMTAELDASLPGRLTKPVFDPANMKPAIPNGVVLVNGTDLTPEPVRWLWKEWLALGKFHMLAGSPGQGKTTLALAFMATVTIGGRWPDGSRAAKGSVLIWSGEDDPADTLLPRLLASGADRSRCYFVSGTRIAGEMESFDPARDIYALEQAVLKIGDVKLIVVDPVVSAVTGDSHKNTEVRRDLQPLVDLASRLDAAMLGITHLSKGGMGSDPASRVIGSVAFTAVARVVMVAAKVKSETGDAREDRRILARGKSNIGRDDGGFEYHIEQSEPLPGIHASYIAWGQAVEGTARELLTDPNEVDSEAASATSEAADSLIRILSRDTVPSKVAMTAMKADGHSEKVTRKARESIGVIVNRTGFGKDTVSYWKLPQNTVMPSDAQSCPSSNVGMTGHDWQNGARLDAGNSEILDAIVKSEAATVDQSSPKAEVI